MKKSARILSLILSSILILGLIPFQTVSFAEETNYWDNRDNYNGFGNYMRHAYPNEVSWNMDKDSHILHIWQTGEWTDQPLVMGTVDIYDLKPYAWHVQFSDGLLSIPHSIVGCEKYDPNQNHTTLERRNKFYNVRSIYVPSSVKEIGYGALYNENASAIYVFSRDADFGNNAVSKNSTLYGYAGSTAEKYAAENGITFVALCEKHNIVPNEKQPTCIKTGSLGGKICKTCKAELELPHAVPALGHDYKKIGVKGPTCTETGYTGDSVCTRCGDIKEKGTAIKPNGHDWDEWKIITYASCTSSGTAVHICKVCGENESTTVKMYGHDYVATVTPVTCTSDGYTTYECSRCHDKYVDGIVKATGHSYVNTVIAPTCTESGYTKHECAKCGDLYKTDIKAATGHKYTASVIAPTCTEDGYTLHTCSQCGNFYKTDTKTMLGHKPVVVPAIAATCTEKGKKEGIKCSVCDIVLREGAVIEPLGHDYIKTTVAPLKDRPGYVADICSRCEDVQNKVLYAYSISFADNEVHLNKGETVTPVVALKPASTADKITWSSSDPRIASVSEDTGVITAVSSGSVTITAKTSFSVSGSFTVNVHVPVSTISFEKNNAEINKGESMKLILTAFPADNTESFAWKSADDKIATVSEDGTITGVSKGKTTISVTSSGGKCASCVITVTNYPTSVTLSQTEASFSILGDTLQLVANVIPTDAEKAAVTWTSSNKKIVEVDETGKLLILADGEADVIASTANGKKAVCKVSVLSFMAGDVDFDERITASDARLALRGAVGLKGDKDVSGRSLDFDNKRSKEFLAADVDSDNKLTASDARLILRAAVGLEKLNSKSHYHVFGAEKTTEPTCENAGFKVSHCRICGFENRVEIPAKGHTWTTKTGIKGRVCSVCGKKECEVYGHKFTTKTTITPTCTKEGKQTNMCSVCGYQTTETIPKADHKYNNKFITPTCTAQGYTLYTCSVCGQQKKDNYTAALGHDWKAATCTTARKCSRCGVSDGKALGHQWNSGKVTKAATCTGKGVKTFTCTVCKTMRTESVAALGHNLSQVARKEPTSKTDGNIEYYHCSRCGKNFSDNKGTKEVTSIVLPKIGTKKLTSTEIYNKCVKYNVVILVTGKDFTATGSGFFISGDGKIVTNYHVIEGAKTINVKDSNGKTFAVEKILAYDYDLDLAVLKISKSSEKATLNKSEYATGNTVYAIGSPRGMDFSITSGIISMKSRNVDGMNYIQHDASITNGNSGGPLIDEYGRVIGINTWGINDSQNLNFAIPVTYLDKLDYSKPLTMAQFANKKIDGSISVSSTSVSLKPGGTTFITVTANVKASSYSITWSCANQSINCIWSEWEGNKVHLAITGYGYCSNVPLKIYISENASISKTVNVTVSSSSSQYLVSQRLKIADFGAITGIVPYDVTITDSNEVNLTYDINRNYTKAMYDTFVHTLTSNGYKADGNEMIDDDTMVEFYTNSAGETVYYYEHYDRYDYVDVVLISFIYRT